MKSLIVKTALIALIALFTAYSEATFAKEKELQVGDRAPDFILVNDFNEKVLLSKFRHKKNIVITFNRAHW